MLIIKSEPKLIDPTLINLEINYLNCSNVAPRGIKYLNNLKFTRKHINYMPTPLKNVFKF